MAYLFQGLGRAFDFLPPAPPEAPAPPIPFEYVYTPKPVNPERRNQVAVIMLNSGFALWGDFVSTFGLLAIDVLTNIDQSGGMVTIGGLPFKEAVKRYQGAMSHPRMMPLSVLGGVEPVIFENRFEAQLAYPAYNTKDIERILLPFLSETPERITTLAEVKTSIPKIAKRLTELEKEYEVNIADIRAMIPIRYNRRVGKVTVREIAEQREKREAERIRAQQVKEFGSPEVRRQEAELKRAREELERDVEARLLEIRESPRTLTREERKVIETRIRNDTYNMRRYEEAAARSRAQLEQDIMEHDELVRKA